MNEIGSYYSTIQRLPRLNQSNILSLYEREAVQITYLDDEIKKLFDIWKKTEEQEKEFNKLRIKRFYKIVNGKKAVNRTYPSTQLINKVVEGNLYLAFYYSKYYYQKVGSDYSFDDLFQIASEALLSAAKYYIPSPIAKFSTYASRCIENRLRRTIYSKESKKRIKDDFFRNELSRLNLIITILKCIDKDRLDFTDWTIYALNRAIRNYNTKMYYCFNKQLPLLKKDSSFQDVIDLYYYLIRDSYIHELVDEGDLDFIKYYISLTEPDYKKRRIRVEIEKVRLYMFRIHCIKELIDFEKKYMREHCGRVPTSEEQYQHLLANQRRLRRSNQNHKRNINSKMNLTFFQDVYYQRYGIDFLSEDKNRNYERKELENLFDIYLTTITRLLDKDSVRVQFYDISGVTIVSLSEIGNPNCVFLSEKILNHDQCKELCDDFICKYGFLDGSSIFVSECVENRVKSVSSFIKNTNQNEVTNNIKSLDFINAMQFYKSKISKKDFDGICKARVTLYSLDDSLETERFSGRTKLSIEEEAEVSDFIDAYCEVLSSLPEEERDVMALCYDINGYPLFDNDEISSRLNIPREQVRNIKTRALKKIRKSSLKNYLDS